MPFDIVAPGVDETRQPGEPVLDYVRRLALEKARSVARERPNSLVIGSDQAAVHRGTIVGKPSGHDEAVRQLLDASGRKITLYTGLALVNTETGHVQSDVVPYAVHFRTIGRAAAERYLEREQPYGCVGSLRAEGLGIALLRKLEGDDPNALIGLPLIRLVEMLELEGVEVV
jgi:septum formation protein